MHNGIRSWSIALAAVAALGAAPSFAQGQAAAKPAARPARIAGQPNFNGIWQAMNTADWNLEAHSAQKIEGFYRLGSLAAIPAGQSVVDGDGKIPYKPEALAKRNENRAKWPESRPGGEMLLAGHPARDVHAVSVSDRPRRRRHPVRVRVRQREPGGAT